MLYQLKHKFNSYEKDGHIYYGGSQMLSEDKNFRKCGCGIVAAADLFLYLHRYHKKCQTNLFAPYENLEHLPASDLTSIYRKLSHFFALIPNFGINGIMLSLGINTFFIRHKIPFYARWGVLPSKLWSTIEEMLENDIPVLMTVGPDFPRIWQKHSANMYPDTAAGQLRSTKVRAHFMTLTAIDDEWMYVSSWGKKYKIYRDEYEFFARNHSTSIASNIMLVTSLDKAP